MLWPVPHPLGASCNVMPVVLCSYTRHLPLPFPSVLSGGHCRRASLRGVCRTPLWFPFLNGGPCRRASLRGVCRTLLLLFSGGFGSSSSSSASALRRFLPSGFSFWSGGLCRRASLRGARRTPSLLAFLGFWGCCSSAVPPFPWKTLFNFHVYVYNVCWMF